MNVQHMRRRVAQGLRLCRCLLGPEDSRDGTWAPAWTPPPWAGRLKALVWFCLALLAGLGLGRGCG